MLAKGARLHTFSVFADFGEEGGLERHSGRQLPSAENLVVKEYVSAFSRRHEFWTTAAAASGSKRLTNTVFLRWSLLCCRCF